MTIYEHVTISHDLVQCTQISNNLNNAPEHFSVQVASPRLTTGHVKHTKAYKYNNSGLQYNCIMCRVSGHHIIIQSSFHSFIIQGLNKNLAL